MLVRKAKTKDYDKEGQRKKQKRVIGSDNYITSIEGSPKYRESNISSSATDTDDGRD
jgi:hypothetical protein